jgi:hypothetical protein
MHVCFPFSHPCAETHMGLACCGIPCVDSPESHDCSRVWILLDSDECHVCHGILQPHGHVVCTPLLRIIFKKRRRKYSTKVATYIEIQLWRYCIMIHASSVMHKITGSCAGLIIPITPSSNEHKWQLKIWETILKWYEPPMIFTHDEVVSITSMDMICFYICNWKNAKFHRLAKIKMELCSHSSL